MLHIGFIYWTNGCFIFQAVLRGCSFIKKSGLASRGCPAAPAPRDGAATPGDAPRQSEARAEPDDWDWRPKRARTVSLSMWTRLESVWDEKDDFRGWDAFPYESV